MKFLLSGVLFAIVSAIDIPSAEWKQYKEKHMKVYTTVHEDTQRLMQYLETKQMIEEHNKRFLNGETKYTMGINRYADWFPHELSKLTNLKVDESRRNEEEEESEVPLVSDAPKSIDWVEKGAVTSVKDQGMCGACYAFSAAGALEGLMFVRNKTVTDLSAQELVDCSGNYGCSGGIMTKCFSYVVRHNGIAKESSYPYRGKKGICRTDHEEIGTTCSGWVEVKKNEVDLENVVGTIGPVSTGLSISKSFIFYKNGVYDGPCDTHINHAMLIVGYGNDKKLNEEYWLIKNSWGTHWGEEGYAKISKGFNTCDIAMLNSYPTF